MDACEIKNGDQFDSLRVRLAALKRDVARNGSVLKALEDGPA
jgi:hypothetical protein